MHIRMRMEPRELILTATRALAVYIFMLIVIRALGKRTVGNFSAFDLLVALMLSELVDEIIYGEVRFLRGSVAIVALAGLAYADSWLAAWSRWWRTVLEGRPTVLVRDGEFDRTGMRKERMSDTDVLAHIRMQGIQDIREVHLAILENDGSVSVLKHPWAEPAQRADIIDDERRAREKALAGVDMPPPLKRTDSRESLSEG